MNAPRRPLSAALPNLAIYALLIVCAAITLVPFLWMLTSAVKNRADFFSSVFLPRGDGFLGFAWDRLTLDNFRRLFTE
ncbi:MAG TPA: hypothetical protein VHO24_02920, partial [Opitutaceae bacterium]|nr:hypothetical protein [Opitutaceae bacterium]